ncbi:molybdopterin cofactor-binding domain-containing protein [Variovorax sp. efr-133-TYG-130]|uniref:xanthine dehydrogenase family protein molybdopterin-binding subunit n=1 Tax=Variovorax sp. efr-133-TYG-130 TaxID=3040327 RepID=UPI0025550E0D|nr:molybdopterin cofactor-binding domain-containing protein [Variovorax sp. efr-133-TYG-130]
MSAQLPLAHCGVRRRQFMQGAAGLTFASIADIPAALAANLEQDASSKTGAPAKTVNAYVSLARDGRVFIQSPATEMGQGSLTSLPVMIAEEMDADWERVVILPAPASDAIYGNPLRLQLQYTAGSAAVWGYFLHLRKFGAQVRHVLLDNVARRWGVPLSELRTEPGFVLLRDGSRRIGYGDIVEFLELPTTAPEIKPEQLKSPSAFRLIGRKDVGRVDVPSKVNGTAQYSIDVQLPSMLYAAISRSPVEGSGPLEVDDRAARKMKGVVDVVRLPFGVGVIADKPWTATKARDSLKIKWRREGRAWGLDSGTQMDAYAKQAADLATAGKPWTKDQAGNAIAALASAAMVLQREYRCDYAYHGQMEPLNVVASVSANGSKCEVWAGTQSQTMAVKAVAEALGIAPQAVTLHSMLMGGAFGRRGNRDMEFVIDGVLLSKAVGRPVKCIWTREDDVKNGRFRPMSVHVLRAGLDDSRRLTAWHHRIACDEVMPFMDPVRYKLNGGNDAIAILGSELKTYDIPNRGAEHLAQKTGVRTSPLRGVGYGPTTFANEGLLDEVAEHLKMDPVALRLQLLAKAPRARAVIEDVVARSKYGTAGAPPGLGLAYLNYAGTEIALVAEVAVDSGNGLVVKNIWATLDCGIPVQPGNVIAQSTGSIVYGLGLALSERITLQDGVVQQSNFYDYLVPRMRDVPPIHCEVISTDTAPTGAGQMTTPLVAPAIASAFHKLTGRRLRHMPFTPERVRAA